MAVDELDLRLLELLQKDCSRSLAELGELVGLSVSGVKDRLRRLRTRGDLRAYVALINPAAIGYKVCAFVQVDVQGKKNEQTFVTYSLRLAEVEECHRVTGDFPYLLKVWARNLEDLDLLIERKLKTQEGVVKARAFVILSSPKDNVTGLAARSAE
jgi:Lrp/AsnC family leucine-responsive transcriptional regulator